MKKVLLILLPLLLIGGGVVGAAFMGFIKIPGITPAKKVAKKGKAAPVVAAVAPKKPIAPTPAPALAPAKKDPPVPAKIKLDQPKIDPEQGADELAKVWSKVDAARLKDIIVDWKDADVASVLAKMKPDKVAEILGAIDVKRASKLSKILEKQASLVTES